MRKPAHPALSRAVRMIVLVLAVATTATLWLQLGGRSAIAGQAGSAPAKSAVLLVNADHPLPQRFATPRLVALTGTLPVSGRQVKVATTISKPLVSLFAAANKAGFTGLYVASGYRSAAEQQQLWDESSDRSYVQRPGHSEHQTGLAVDLADLKAGAKGLHRSPAGHWLADNSWRYGFVLRYPTGKKSITGIAYEPWHFRYVGRQVAETCHTNDWVLEEYVAAH